ncbi:helix-turn-helix transcriptional regulator [Vagococcus fluvialis]|uniref:helix-turn-helix domain-containing protein n=1 Tax=Vagococcus fluvialis TaxID=2738 RepID=UPI0037B0851F
MKPNKERVANRIKIIRANLGYSIAEMAEKLGISKSTLNSYIRALAMPPEKVISKLSSISGMKEEWILYGDSKEYISDYVSDLGYSKFLEDYPNVVDEMLLKWEVHSSEEGLLSIYDSSNIYVLKSLFKEFYHPIYRQYIDDIVSDYSEKIADYPLYGGSREFNSKKYKIRVHERINSDPNTIKYGDYDRIREIGKDEYYERIRVYKQFEKNNIIEEDKFLPYLIEMLSTDEGAEYLISKLAETTNNRFNNNTQMGKEIIDIFRSMKPSLEKLKNKFSNEEQKQTFTSKIKDMFK